MRGTYNSVISRLEGTAHDNKETADPTGCGDVFGAAYCAHFMKTENIQASAQFANRVAGWNATQRGTANIDSLGQFRLNESALREKTE